ncbi:MAG: bifunctional nuclease family protein [Acidimicrobiales bacterium]
MQEMEVVGVRVELPTNAPIVLLRERGGEARLLPIFIGGAEASSISLALDGHEPPRPMTHDLMRNVLENIDVTLERIVITELTDRTFFAELNLRRVEDTWVVSSRPSDAIALAVRTGAPVFVADPVLDVAGYSADTELPDDLKEEAEHEVVVEEFRQFIEEINPDDFS